jgi:hypothetical protein
MFMGFVDVDSIGGSDLRARETRQIFSDELTREFEAGGQRA